MSEIARPHCAMPTIRTALGVFGFVGLLAWPVLSFVVWVFHDWKPGGAQGGLSLFQGWFCALCLVTVSAYAQMTMLRKRIAFRGWFVALALLAAGCASSRAKIVSPQQLPLYGSDSLHHTVYVGSDDHHHHFMWSRGLRRGEYLVDRSALHLSREFPKGAGHAFLSRTSDGSVDVLTLLPRKAEQDGAANGTQPLSPDSRAMPGEASPRR